MGIERPKIGDFFNNKAISRLSYWRRYVRERNSEWFFERPKKDARKVFGYATSVYQERYIGARICCVFVRSATGTGSTCRDVYIPDSSWTRPLGLLKRMPLMPR